MATAWLQRSDFSSEELGELSENKMISTFSGVDWQAENLNCIESDPNACCPPGFGINMGANILHLCPYDERNMFFHLHYGADVRLLKIIRRKRKESHYVEN